MTAYIHITTTYMFISYDRFVYRMPGVFISYEMYVLYRMTGLFTSYDRYVYIICHVSFYYMTCLFILLCQICKEAMSSTQGFSHTPECRWRWQHWCLHRIHIHLSAPALPFYIIRWQPHLCVHQLSQGKLRPALSVYAQNYVSLNCMVLAY